MSSYQCEAEEYGDCDIHTDVYDVTFNYSDAKGRCGPDEIKKVCICKYHYNWLRKIHKGEQLHMRGEAPEYALHDDLFDNFAYKNNMYTLMKVEFDHVVDGEKEVKEVKEVKEEEQYYLFNGRDIESMCKVIEEWFPNKHSRIRIYEKGFFQTTTHYDHYDANDIRKWNEDVIEVKYITDKIPIAALTNSLSNVYMMAPQGREVAIGTSAHYWIPRAKTDPMYVKEPMPELFKHFFTTLKI